MADDIERSRLSDDSRSTAALSRASSLDGHMSQVTESLSGSQAEDHPQPDAGAREAAEAAYDAEFVQRQRSQHDLARGIRRQPRPRRDSHGLAKPYSAAYEKKLQQRAKREEAQAAEERPFDFDRCCRTGCFARELRMPQLRSIRANWQRADKPTKYQFVREVLACDGVRAHIYVLV
jgi:hypothetical protein